jgi:hypothetical protein
VKPRFKLPSPKATHRLDLTRAELRAMKAEDKVYPVDRLVDIPRDKWPSTLYGLIAAKRSRDFLVQIYAEPDGIIRLSIQRCQIDLNTGSWLDGITWDELQHLKTLAGYGDRVAVEIYPPDSEVVNIANIRHLWLLNEAPAFMWQKPASK